jgi:TPP-dependent pyruvate/acetoin dehydrogenase alpha subunit
MTYIGDGGASVGEVHEGLMMASVMRLPLILIIENNQYAYSTPIAKQFIVEKLSSRAAGYGIPGVTVDGTDVLEVYRACKEAVARARKGDGPSIVESVTMRMHGHAAHDNAWYVPKQLLADWKKKDPLEKFEKWLSAHGYLTESKKSGITGKIEAELEEAVKAAEASPFAPGGDALRDVYA